MQNNILYFGLFFAWLLLLISILLAIFSKFKHTQFKQSLLRFLNITLMIQLLVVAVLTVNNTTLNSLIPWGWLVVGFQMVCNLISYKSVKRRQNKVKSTLDSFSMD